ATVVPSPTKSTSAGATLAILSSCAIPSIGATCGVFGVEGSLWNVGAPLSSTRTRSVKVPPTSIPIRARAIRSRLVVFDRTVGADEDREGRHHQQEHHIARGTDASIMALQRRHRRRGAGSDNAGQRV